MPTLTGSNVLEWKMKELARRAGKKYEPEGQKNMYESMTAKELKEHKDMLSAALKESEDN
jgi:hypothetical protein